MAATTTTTDDFSFPTTANPPLQFIGSPPLWRRTASTPSPHKETERKSPKVDDERESWNSKENSLDRKPIKSFSCVERGPKAAHGVGSGKEEEKMDSLWEDFNEELSRTQGSTYNYCEFSPGRRAADHCVQGLKLSKRGGGGAVISGKRQPGVVVFMKVLKRVFLLHSSHRTVKNRTRWSKFLATDFGQG